MEGVEWSEGTVAHLWHTSWELADVSRRCFLVVVVIFGRLMKGVS